MGHIVWAILYGPYHMGHILSDDKSTYYIFSIDDSGTEQAKLLQLPVALRDSVDNACHMFRIASKILRLLFSSLLTELNWHDKFFQRQFVK